MYSPCQGNFFFPLYRLPSLNSPRPKAAYSHSVSVGSLYSGKISPFSIEECIVSFSVIDLSPITDEILPS